MSTTQTQGRRILQVLSDGRWHTTAEIHRRAGYSRLNSRVSELRKQGWVIDCEHVPGKSGSSGYRYRWYNAPADLTLAVGDLPEEGASVHGIEEEVPRTLETRYRIYCVPRYGEQTLIGTAPTPEAVGVLLVEKGRAGELKGCTVGILDTHGLPKEVRPGDWLANPHEGRW